MTYESKSKTTIANPFYQRRGFFWEARTRILVWYIALMTGFIGFSIPIFSQLVLDQVNTRVREDLSQDVKNFKIFIKQQGEPANPIELAKIFQEFLFRHIPEDDTFLITMIDGNFDRSSPRAKPKLLQENSELMMRWAKLKQHTEAT